MVYNDVTYPNLIRLFEALEVPTKPAPMSFSVHHGPSGVEWNGSGLNTLFAQRKNLLSLRHWRFLRQLNRFNKEACDALDDPRWQEMTLGEYVSARGYGKDFLDRYLIPMSSAVWSAPRQKMLRFPAVTLLRFWYNHGFLGLDTQHPWRTVDGGAQEYVRRLIEPIRDRIHLNTPVGQVWRDADGVEIITHARGVERFDRVILATHAPQSLKLLESPTVLENELLSRFSYQPNEVKLHTDPRFMPDTRRCWAAWNYRSDVDGSEVNATTHYWMNCLQGVSDQKNYFVSLNTSERVSDEDCLRKINYEHPLFDLEALRAQKRLPELNRTGNGNRTYYCGAWFRYGFHEDGLLSAVDLCHNLLGGDPWERR